MSLSGASSHSRAHLSLEWGALKEDSRLVVALYSQNPYSALLMLLYCAFDGRFRKQQGIISDYLTHQLLHVCRLEVSDRRGHHHAQFVQARLQITRPTLNYASQDFGK